MMRRTALLVAAILAPVLMAGCGSAHAARTGSGLSGAEASTGESCGQSFSAGHVPVTLEVDAGTVPCAQAEQVESTYNHDLTAGLAPGNGGGGPVRVDGWTCQGFPTPHVLQTGEVSKCARNGNEFDALLASPSASPSHS
jgi:hypothetical protein